MYKTLQIKAPPNRNAKNPPLNRPSEYKRTRGIRGVSVKARCPQGESRLYMYLKFRRLFKLPDKRRAVIGPQYAAQE